MCTKKGTSADGPGKRFFAFFQQKRMRSTEPSHPLPDDSTTSARSSLTALFEWEAVSRGDVAALARTGSSRHQTKSKTAVAHLAGWADAWTPRAGSRAGARTGADRAHGIEPASVKHPDVLKLHQRHHADHRIGAPEHKKARMNGVSNGPAGPRPGRGAEAIRPTTARNMVDS